MPALYPDVNCPGSPTLYFDLQAFLVDAADHTAVSHVKSVPGLLPFSCRPKPILCSGVQHPAHLPYFLDYRPSLWTLQTTQQSHTSKSLTLCETEQSCCHVDADPYLLFVHMSIALAHLPCVLDYRPFL